MVRDLKQALRVLGKKPGLTAAAVFTLALGIGGSAAMFSVIDGVLVRPLPYRDPDRLVAIWERNVQTGVMRKPTSPPNFADWQIRSRTFEGMAASVGFMATLTEPEPDRIPVCAVSPGFFSLLGIQPLLGRSFVPDDHRPGREAVALLSATAWEKRFGRDPSIIGRKLALARNVSTIIGVLPLSYRQPALADGEQAPEAWVPVDFSGSTIRQEDFLSIVARVKPGIRFEQARTEMAALGLQLAQQYPSNAPFEIETTPLKETVVAHARKPLWLLLGAVAMLLLIGCVNVSNLMLARATQRRKEFAIRVALGASYKRLFRQVIAECIVLSLAGGALGVVLAAGGLNSLIAIGSASIPRADQIHLNGWILLLTFVLSSVTGLAFGTIPALDACRTDLNEPLKAPGAGTSGGTVRQKRLRASLVVGEVALTLVILVAAGLLLRSFWNIQNKQLGFEPHRVVVAEVRLPTSPNNGALTAGFLRELLDRISRLPGVQAAGATGTVPLRHNAAPPLPFSIEGRPASRDGEPQHAVLSVATPGYFKAMRIPLRRGRIFEDRDAGGGVPVVVLINEAFARRYFPNEDPVGRRLILDGPAEIVGVVADVPQGDLLADPQPQVYSAHAQRSWPTMTLTIRTASAPEGIIGTVRGILKAMDKTRPLYNIRTAEQLRAGSLAQRKFSMILFGAFAAVALGLACIGIYGVLAYSVAQRTQEIGLRMALGAGPRGTLMLILRGGLGMTLLGLIAGALLALAVTRFMQSLLYGITAEDPMTFAGVAGLFLAVAFVATYLPARSATRVDPIIALRYE